MGRFTNQDEQIPILSGPKKGFPNGTDNACCFHSTLKRFKGTRLPKGLSVLLEFQKMLKEKRWVIYTQVNKSVNLELTYDSALPLLGIEP